MNKPAESTRFRVKAAREAAILRGDIRDDLIRDEVLADLFAATARARPDHPALIFGETRHSYGEVDARSDAIARGLIERGIGPGDVVGLWMGRGPELLIAQIAIAKSGAAWLPFDADAPVDRIAVCLADAGAKGLADERGARRQGGGRLPGPDLGRARPDRRRRAARSEGPRAQPRPPGLSHLHLGLDRHAEGHRRHPSQYLPLPARLERALRLHRRRRGLPGRLRRLRPVDGGDLDPLHGRRDARRREPGDDRRRREAARHPHRGRRHRARHRADAARAPQPRHPLRAADPARRRGAAAAARLPLVEARPAALQHLRPDRSDGRRDRLRAVPRRARDDRAADPELQQPMWSTRASISCRRAFKASFSSAVPASPRATSSARS